MDKNSSYCKIKQNAGYGLHHIWNKPHMVIDFGKYPVYSRTILRIEWVIISFKKKPNSVNMNWFLSSLLKVQSLCIYFSPSSLYHSLGKHWVISVWRKSLHDTGLGNILFSALTLHMERAREKRSIDSVQQLNTPKPALEIGTMIQLYLNRDFGFTP